MDEPNQLSSFLESSKGFGKNPLGIIALFISLIYGFACFVLGVSGGKLEKYERLILIIFLVAFPVLILISFLFLVTRHYRKLYAPSDFKDEKNYLETIDITSQKSRILNQVIESKIQQESIHPINADNQVDTYRDYLIIENLVLRIVEKEFGLPYRRNVKFKGHKNSFDCIIEGKDIFVGVEIKYFYKIEEDHTEAITLHFKRKFHAFQRIANEYYPEMKKKFVLYIVYNNDIDIFIKRLRRLFEKENILEIELKFYEYENILNEFGFNE